MKIRWLGHACFLIAAENGTRILTDPFDATVGYPVPRVAADIVTTSHRHYDHNHVQAVTGPFTLVDKPGRTAVRGIDINGISTFHDNIGGARGGKNLVFTFVVDGLNVCHCGDLGHLPSAEQTAEIGPVDILLVPVGGNYTIDAATAAALCGLLRPTVVIPMHFKTPAIAFPIAGVDPFLAAMGGGRRAGAEEIDLDTRTIAAQAGVIILDYPGG